MISREAYRAGLHLAGTALIAAVAATLAGAFLFFVMVIAGGAHG